ncbi:MAG TPA: hypothetical protein VD816_11460 [Ohtaekwangia sp.]|nr:hypothetical protein [Ohtaekwangia sp.]
MNEVRMTTGESRIAKYPVNDHKAFIEDFYNKVFVHKNRALIEYYVHRNCVEHNPGIALRGLAFFLADPAYVVRKIQRVIPVGNFVAVQAEGLRNQRPCIFYDIFSIEAGKISAHWSVDHDVSDKQGAPASHNFSTHR